MGLGEAYLANERKDLGERIEVEEVSLSGCDEEGGMGCSQNDTRFCDLLSLEGISWASSRTRHEVFP